MEYQVDKLEYKGGWVAEVFASMGNFTIRSPRSKGERNENQTNVFELISVS